MRSRIVAPILTVLVCLSASGCKVTTEDIDYWMGTQKGPGKIVAVLLADKYEDDLRVHAARALVLMEPRGPTRNHPAVDGVTELHLAMSRLPEDVRTRLVDQLVPDLIAMMTGEATPQAETSGIPPLQIRAKDAAFLMLQHASPAQQETLRNAIIDWFAVDFTGRNLAGNFSAEQVVRRLGAPGAERLVMGMNARLLQHPQALVKVSELISTLGDDATKAAAAARLVELEREMESEAFTESLQAQLRTQLEARPNYDASNVNDQQLLAAAVVNRESFITIGALPAMKHLNDQRAIQDRLLEMAQTTTVEGLAEEKILDRRVKALQALEGGVRPDQVDALVTLALNEDSPLGVRDTAFDRIADSRSTAALARLWPAFTSATDWRLRWRLGSLILTLGRGDVVADFFERLNAEEYAQEELHGYGERLGAMRPAPREFVLGQLTSEDWQDRTIALYFLEKRNEVSDIPRVMALAGDEAETHGEHWGDQGTVGAVAQAVAALIRRANSSGDEEGSSADEGE